VQHRGCADRLPTLVVLVVSALVKIALAAGTASDGPGVGASWTTGNKLAVGSSAEKNSKVWFTVANGITSEVFYPRLDIPNILLTDSRAASRRPRRRNPGEGIATRPITTAAGRAFVRLGDGSAVGLRFRRCSRTTVSTQATFWRPFAIDRLRSPVLIGCEEQARPGRHG
jgi:Glucodextranase, domain N